ncbi:MAG: TMEM175 family protein [Actinomycetota bacterium]|nr:TMEM175 family protein [Actinomycetota bacterium]
MEQNETARIEAFSDGVFAIAITLLIIEIHVPDPSHTESLGHELLQTWPSYVAYLTSFLTIGVMWINHHHVFSFITQADRTLLLLNTLLLMMIAFVPFPTAVLAQFIETKGAREGALLYGATLTLTAIVFFAWWRYASADRRLIGDHVADEQLDEITRAYTPGTLLYGGSALVAFISPWVSAALYLLIAVFYALPLSEWRARLLRGQ